MDILLINSSVKRRNFHAAMTPPLGLAYIGAVLIENGYSVAAIDLNVTSLSEEELSAYLQENRPKMVGISAYTETYNNAVWVAGIVKQTDPGCKVVVGGPHVSVMYKQTARSGVFDVVERGEGEITNLELAQLFIRGKGSLEQIDGIAFLRDGEVVVTPEREPIQDIDTLPFPAHSKAINCPLAFLPAEADVLSHAASAQ